MLAVSMRGLGPTSVARRLAATNERPKRIELEPGFRVRFFHEILPQAIADTFAEAGRLLGLPD